jgi:hypothetical protein
LVRSLLESQLDNPELLFSFDGSEEGNRLGEKAKGAPAFAYCWTSDELPPEMAKIHVEFVETNMKEFKEIAIKKVIQNWNHTTNAAHWAEATRYSKNGQRQS